MLIGFDLLRCQRWMARSDIARSFKISYTQHIRNDVATLLQTISQNSRWVTERAVFTIAGHIDTFLCDLQRTVRPGPNIAASFCSDLGITAVRLISRPDRIDLHSVAAFLADNATAESTFARCIARLRRVCMWVVQQKQNQANCLAGLEPAHPICRIPQAISHFHLHTRTRRLYPNVCRKRL